MKFRYYITDLHAGKIIGTNDTDAAQSFAFSEDHFVVDSQEGLWITSDGSEPVEAYPRKG